MLATFVIGLREGLEAALIVGIIAAFLRRNRISLKPMCWGVALAVFLSVAVGVMLHLFSQSLPQAQQEGLETIIGGVAVVFVTTMIVWMSTHGRTMKSSLEQSAQTAITDGGALALAVMAFLAVLKEGFETAVFLLATLQSGSNQTGGLIGAVLGILLAVGLGVALFLGGVRLNLGRFFTVTGVFLVFVAAGLVMSCLRTAHEAGWVTIGQQRVADLEWLIPHGTVASAIVTGVFGLQPDPRLIEVVTGAIYLLSVLGYLFWPRRWRASNPRKLRAWMAGGLAACAVLLFVLVPSSPSSDPQWKQPLQLGGTVRAAARGDVLDVVGPHGRRHLHSSGGAAHAGADAVAWASTTVHRAQQTMTLDALIASNSGRIPVGIDRTRTPGPYRVTLQSTDRTKAWTNRAVGLLDASSTTQRIMVVSGGGLVGTRIIGMPEKHWQMSASAVRKQAAEAAEIGQGALELTLWRLWLPAVALLAALCLIGYDLLQALRGRNPVFHHHLERNPHVAP